MRVLLDTHVLLWTLDRPERLGPKARDTITDPANTVLVSIVSLWEITVKRRVGKMDADPIRLIDRLPSQGFDRLGIEDPHLRALDGLPAYHRDPFDHLLIAQAIAEGAAFMSRDRKADRYPVELVSPVR